MSYDISVIICTYNRAEVLRETLRSWLSLKNAGANVELIVVDNNSSDHTSEVVEAFRPSCSSHLLYTIEVNAGLSHARNKGIRESDSDIVAFVDDDVLFDENWLSSLLAMFQSDKNISCIGGKSIPVFDAEKPEWITDDLLSLYGSTRSGDLSRPMVFPEFPYGLNMAFRKSVFSSVGLFDVNLGRKKTSLLSNEERDIFNRVNTAGLKVFYNADALIYHRIPVERITKTWVSSRCYWQGISDAVSDQTSHSLTKIELLSKTIFALLSVVMPLGKRTPKRLFQYYRNFSFKDKLSLLRQAGMAKHYFFSIFPNSYML